MTANNEAIDDGSAVQGGEAAETHSQPSESQPGDEQQAEMHTYIGSRLRQVFDDIASQPIPDRFLQLMRDLD